MACAMALQGYHDIVVFESGPMLGGHAMSVAVSRGADGAPQVKRVRTPSDLAGASHADVGATFFNAPAYPAFNRLLSKLGVQVNDMLGSVSITPFGAKHPLCIPFSRHGKLSVAGLTPRVGVWGLRLQQVLTRAEKELKGETFDGPTLAEFLVRQRFDPYPEPSAAPPAAEAAHRRRAEQLAAAGRRLAKSSFHDQFLLPLIESFWGALRSDVLGYSARNALGYMTGSFKASPLKGAAMREIEGGLGVYAGAVESKLAATPDSVRVRTHCAVSRLRHDPLARTYTVESRAPAPAPFAHLAGAGAAAVGGGYGPEPGQGPGDVVVHPEAFDAVVVATNGWWAKQVLADVPHAAPVREVLGTITYLPGHIAIHGDMSVIPAKESARSVVNITVVPEATPLDDPPAPSSGCCTCGAGPGAPFRGTMRGFFTAYKPWHFAPGLPVLKTWLNPALLRRPELLPQPMYLLQEFYHPQPNVAYYKVPALLEHHQGAHGLHLAGLHAGGSAVDDHETALLTGLRAARRLAPQSAFLAEIWPEGARGAA